MTWEFAALTIVAQHAGKKEWVVPKKMEAAGDAARARARTNDLFFEFSCIRQN